jgi:5-methylcytosine-specific restriction endonuclease McrA
MSYDKHALKRIYDRTTGYCHICGKKLSFTNYALYGQRGAWEVEHSNPRAKSGQDHLNNLFASCITCNREKKTVTTPTARSWHGRRKAPLSRVQRKNAKKSNAIAGGILGGLVGAVAGPWGAVAGAALGAKLAHDSNPDND